MKKKLIDFGTPDEENPELTADFYKNARPLSELLSKLAAGEKTDKPKKTTQRHLHAA